jgi:hypothetical protein
MTRRFLLFLFLLLFLPSACSLIFLTNLKSARHAAGVDPRTVTLTLAVDSSQSHGIGQFAEFLTDKLTQQQLAMCQN